MPGGRAGACRRMLGGSSGPWKTNKRVQVVPCAPLLLDGLRMMTAGIHISFHIEYSLDLLLMPPLDGDCTRSKSVHIEACSHRSCATRLPSAKHVGAHGMLVHNDTRLQKCNHTP